MNTRRDLCIHVVFFFHKMLSYFIIGIRKLSHFHEMYVLSKTDCLLDGVTVIERDSKIIVTTNEVVKLNKCRFFIHK